MVLKRMKGQRRPVEPGDVFVLQLERDDSYRFGRVVKTGEPTREARFPGGILAYVYAPAAKEPEPPRSELTRDRLLLPPFFTHKWMWSKGYFNTVDHWPVEATDLLPQHCFYSGAYDGYVDENDRRLDHRVEPCGWFSLANLQTLEEEIGGALAGKPVSARYPAGHGPED